MTLSRNLKDHKFNLTEDFKQLAFVCVFFFFFFFFLLFFFVFVYQEIYFYASYISKRETYPNYNATREKYLEALLRNHATHELLFGKDTSADEENEALFLKVQDYILKSKRFVH